MYDKRTSAKIEKIASDAIDSTQAKIDLLNSMDRDESSRSSSQLLGWQSWIGNIAFALAAIFGAFLSSKDYPNSYSLISFLLFLLTGLWIAIFHKNIFERAVATSSLGLDKFRILYDNKKKAAFDLFNEPSSLEKHLEFLNQELIITKMSEKNEKSILKTFKEDRTSYLNDVWLAMLVSAIYFMMWPTASTVYRQVGARLGYFTLLFWYIWAILMLIISKEALSSQAPIALNRKSKIQKLNSQLKHTKAYKKRIMSEMTYLTDKIAA